MVVFLLLLVIAILLVGASAIIGALGAVLGVVAFIASIIALCAWLNIGPESVMFIMQWAWVVVIPLAIGIPLWKTHTKSGKRFSAYMDEVNRAANGK